MNRRANIDEKKISLSPSAVGTPGEDRSGQILASGVQNFAKALIDREDKADSVAAMSKFGDFNAAYAQGKAELQLKYKDKPKEYPRAAKELGELLTTQFSKNMSTGTAQKFREMTTNYAAQDQDNVVGWSIKQDQDNILGGIQRSYGNTALAAEAVTNPQGLRGILSQLDAVYKTSEPFLTASSNLNYKLETRKQAIDNALNSAILSNPGLAYGNLARGAYDDMLTPGEVKKYSNQAHQAQIDGANRAQYEGLKTSAVALSTTADAIMNGTTTVGEVSRMLSVYELHKDEKDVNGNPVVAPEIIEGFKTLKEMALRQMPKSKFERTIESKTALEQFDNRWDRFLAANKKRDTPEAALEEVKIYAELYRNYQEGIINSADFQVKKNILDKKVATRAGRKSAGLNLEQAFEKAGVGNRWPWANDDDLYTEGFDIISRKVNTDPDFSPEERRRIRDQYFLTYIQDIDKRPPESINNMQNHKTAATNILNGNGTKENPGLFNRMAIYKHPETGEPIVYGQVILLQGQPVICRGKNPQTGNLRIGISDSVVEGLENR